MANAFSLRDKIFFAGDADEDGDLCVTAQRGMIFMTRKEMRQLRDHLNTVLDESDRRTQSGAIYRGCAVKVIKTSHTDLLGEVGRVENITPSGNYEVYFRNGSESVILGPEQVERA